MAGTLYLGTSGYAYAEWKGVFYPEDLKTKDQLRYFAARFRSVEINYTFRQHPSEKTLAAWREQTPEGFLFTLKAHQNITHRRRLKDAEAEVAFFLERARLLGERLGVILFQCPPNLRFEEDRAQAFLAALPPGGRYAMEFRHPSWEDARELLTSRGVAWCTAETDDQPPPATPGSRSPTSASARRPTRRTSWPRGPHGSGRDWSPATTCSATSSTRRRASAPDTPNAWPSCSDCPRRPSKRTEAVGAGYR